MSWIVQWNGKEYDIDPTEFSGRELGLIKLRTSYTYQTLIGEGIPSMDAEAFRALFWIVDLRRNPELKYTDYDGPPMKVIIPALPDFINAAEELINAAEAMGKARVSKETTPTTETSGGHYSPNGSPHTETEMFTTA